LRDVVTLRLCGLRVDSLRGQVRAAQAGEVALRLVGLIGSSSAEHTRLCALKLEVVEVVVHFGSRDEGDEPVAATAVAERPRA
jgi:hypothetical protein